MNKEKKQVKKLRKETIKVWNDLLKRRHGFPLLVVYGVGEEREQTLNVAHVDFVNSRIKDAILERIRIWANGGNPQCDFDFGTIRKNGLDTEAMDEAGKSYQ